MPRAVIWCCNCAGILCILRPVATLLCDSHFIFTCVQELLRFQEWSSCPLGVHGTTTVTSTDNPRFTLNMRRRAHMFYRRCNNRLVHTTTKLGLRKSNRKQKSMIACWMYTVTTQLAVSTNYMVHLQPRDHGVPYQPV